MTNRLLSSGILLTPLHPADSTTSGRLSTTGTKDNFYTLSSLLAEFTGPGNISLAASTFTQTLLANNGGNTYSSQVTNAGLTGDCHLLLHRRSSPVGSPSIGSRSPWSRRDQEEVSGVKNQTMKQ